MTHPALPKALEAILDLARWAPSGDNAQPWKFRVTGDHDVEVLIRRTNPNIYEYRHGEPTLLSAGALLENIDIAAPAFGLKASWRYAGSADGVDHIAVHFSEAETVPTPHLLGEIIRRSVDRRLFKMRALTEEQMGQLAIALAPDIQLQWYHTMSDRREIAALSGLATKIRLTIPETFSVHRGIVDWEHERSARGIPSRALGLDPLTLKLTRWSMVSWRRTQFMNALGAPFFASMQMDTLPGLFCASYFAMRIKRRSGASEAALAETLRAGQAIQRFWLTATRLGLAMQPCVAILAFWVYGAAQHPFTSSPKALKTSHKLARDAERVFGPNEEIIFLGRVGRSRSASQSRSTRLALPQLLVS